MLTLRCAQALAFVSCPSLKRLFLGLSRAWAALQHPCPPLTWQSSGAASKQPDCLACWAGECMIREACLSQLGRAARPSAGSLWGSFRASAAEQHPCSLGSRSTEGRGLPFSAVAGCPSFSRLFLGLFPRLGCAAASLASPDLAGFLDSQRPQLPCVLPPFAGVLGSAASSACTCRQQTPE